ncbi:MAG: glycosyltransferase [Deltaproteobacteria bacterium]|nr:glycosyltransferase [Deltaproteobacteria bacterium]MBT6435812.1 glycosyltransferase [Deltaproteobacteria bacterium]
MRICLFTVSLNRQMTGIDKVAVELANEMVKRGHEVSYISHPGGYQSERLVLDESVTRYTVNQNYSNKTIKLLKSIITKDNPDVVLPMVTNSIVAIFANALWKTGIPLLISEHNNPEYYLDKWWKLGRNFDERLKTRFILFNAADKIHLLNESFKQDLPAFLHDKTVVIKNPTHPSKPVEQVQSFLNRKKELICVGRVENYQKNLLCLVRAFATIHEECPDWSLRIVGTGPSSKFLAQQAAKFGIADKVIFHGQTDTPEELYSQAQIYCIPSRFEGCPLGLIEAMSHGLPAVGFAECSGVNEMIIDGETGLLANGMASDSFAEQLLALIHDDDLRLSCSEKSTEASKKYSPDAIYDQWEKVIIETAQLKGKTKLTSFEPVDDQLRYDVGLSEILEQNIFWRYFPNSDTYKKKYKELVGSRSWKAGAVLRFMKKQKVRVAEVGLVTSLIDSSEYFFNHAYKNNKLMTRMTSKLRSDEVVGIDIPNLTDVQDLLQDHVQGKFLLKNLEYGIAKELRIGSAKVIVSGAGAAKTQFSAGAKRVEIWHAAGAVKSFSSKGYRQIKNDYVICAPSEHVRGLYAKFYDVKAEHVRVTGVPKTDLYFDQDEMARRREEFFSQYPEFKNKKIYFYAPTFRGVWSKKVSLDLELNFEELAASLHDDEVLITKLHPRLLENSGVTGNLSGISKSQGKIVNLSDYSAASLIIAADVVISDYSSLIFEAVLAQKPLICYAEDIDRYEHDRGFGLDYREEMPCPIIEEPSAPVLLSALRGASIDQERYATFTAKFLSACDGNASSRVITVIEELLGKPLKESSSALI